MKNPTVTVIVLSYNRPKMLQQALESIKDADEVILCDDGSDFDVEEVAAGFQFPIFEILGAPPISIEDRLTTQRLPALINAALEVATGDIITYLCDDDLFDQHWLHYLKKFYSEYKNAKYHIVRGHCVLFEGGKDISFKEATRHLMSFTESPRQLITGNFAHLRQCYTEEMLKWNEATVIGHDTAFFDNMENHHDTWTIPLLPAVACYRRIHDKMLSNHLWQDDKGGIPLADFSDSAKQFLKENQFLE